MYKKIVLIFLSSSFAICSDLSILHPQKQEIQNYKLQEIKNSYENEKYNWINPATVSLSTNKNKSVTSGTTNEIQNASIGVSQDIFRFGGIDYAISYANANKEVKILDLEIENSKYLEQIYTSVLTIKKLKLQLEQSEYSLKNKELDIFLKNEQYKKGLVDITSLNSAIMDKNTELKNILTMKQSITIQQKELGKLTPLQYDKIELPKFTFLGKENFIKTNYQINQANLSSKATDAQLKITNSNYYPHLTFSGELGYQNYVNSYDGDYYNMGLKLSLPLDFNKKTTIEQSKIANLKQKVALEDKQIEQILNYEEIASNIKNYQDYQEITKKNIELYKEILDMTQKGFEAGYKTGYDLQIIQNTQHIDTIEINIYDINIQLEFLKLHYSMIENKGYNG
jgi:outer membrane protein TolC